MGPDIRQRLNDNQFYFDRIKYFFEPTINMLEDYIERYAFLLRYLTMLYAACLVLVVFPITIEICAWTFLAHRLILKPFNLYRFRNTLAFCGYFYAIYVLLALVDPAYSSYFFLNAWTPALIPYLNLAVDTVFSFPPFSILMILYGCVEGFVLACKLTYSAIVNTIQGITVISMTFLPNYFILSVIYFGFSNPIAALFIFKAVYVPALFEYFSFDKLSTLPFYIFYIPVLSYLGASLLKVALRIPILFGFIDAFRFNHYLYNPILNMQSLHIGLRIWFASMGVPTFITSVGILITSLLAYDYIANNIKSQLYSIHRDGLSIWLLCLALAAFQANLVMIAFNPIRAIPLLVVALPLTFSQHSSPLVKDIGKILFLNLLCVPLFFQPYSAVHFISHVYYFVLPTLNTAYLFMRYYYPDKLLILFGYLTTSIKKLTSKSYLANLLTISFSNATKRIGTIFGNLDYSFSRINQGIAYRRKLFAFRTYFHQPEQVPPADKPKPNVDIPEKGYLLFPQLHRIRLKLRSFLFPQPRALKMPGSAEITGHIKALYDHNTPSSHLYTLSSENCLEYSPDRAHPAFALQAYQTYPGITLRILDSYIDNETDIEKDRYPRILFLRETLFTRGLIEPAEADRAAAAELTQYFQARPIRARLRQYMLARLKNTPEYTLFRQQILTLLLCFKRSQSQYGSYALPYFHHFEKSLFRLIFECMLRSERGKFARIVEHLNPATTVQKERTMRNTRSFFLHGDWLQPIPDQTLDTLRTDFYAFKTDILRTHIGHAQP